MCISAEIGFVMLDNDQFAVPAQTLHRYKPLSLPADAVTACPLIPTISMPLVLSEKDRIPCLWRAIPIRHKHYF